ncbi:MAG: glycoside hydrolase family 2 TIM barrel-domain containing protein [Eubacteriales bacterium]|nr:glycoside hydrolase family 2 TIM barrel-domain containing protein [Eubacteriales bacterium]
MKEISFNFDWKRTLGKKMPWETDRQETTIDLPDDFIIHKKRSPQAVGGARVGYLSDDFGTYEKEFMLPREWEKKPIFLNLDGAYMNTEITVNDHYLGHHPYGYTPYWRELTGLLFFDRKNKISISTQGHQPSSRWYSGGGIYREATLLVGEECYLAPWDLYITTPAAEKEEAKVRGEMWITNTNQENIPAKVRFELRKEGKEAASMERFLELKGQGKTHEIFELPLKNPLLWDADHPELYDASVRIETPHQNCETVSLKIGIRKIQVDAEEGLKVNGRKVTLHGGCIHHDNGMLGAKAFPKAEERKVRKLKEAGFNAIRTAHNPPSKALLDACDRYGMYVIDEIFDCWRIGKNQNDYHLWFEDWWKRDIEATVLRDRNHPSVYCWSFGNEIPEARSFHAEGEYWVKCQADAIRSLDASRLVTLGGMFLPKHLTWDGFPGGVRGPLPVLSPYISEEEEETHFRQMIENLDIVSLNYSYRNYGQFGKYFPGKALQGTETEGIDTWENREAVRKHSFVVGDFVWTAHDNLGEAGAGRSYREEPKEQKGLMGGWPWLTSCQADLALDGERLPRSYYRKVIWGLDKGIYVFTTHPQFTGKPLYGTGFHWHDVRKVWTFSEQDVGKPMEVEAYADCDEVLFEINGKTVAAVTPKEMIAKAVIPYEPGVLCAKAYRNGRFEAEDTIETTGKATQILLVPESDKIRGDGMDLGYVEIFLADDKGRRVFGEEREIQVQVSGAGTLEGLGSNNPCTEEDFTLERRKTFEGKAILAIRAGRQQGTVKITVEAEGLPDAACQILVGERKEG